MIDNTQAAREIFWNVSSPPNVILMYAAFAVSFAVCSWGLWRRYCLWSAGRPAPERLGDWPARFGLLLRYALGQKKVNREAQARVFHSLIFWGFLVLLFTTTMVFIDHDLGIAIYHGRFYLAVTVLSDLFGLGLLIGVCYAYYIRAVVRPDRLHTTSADRLMLVLLGLLVVQGFALEALRIHATADPWALYSPVGWAMSQFFWNLSEPATRLLHFTVWWFHALTVFVFIALLPYTKFLHILSSSANLFFGRLRRPKGALPYPGDIEEIMERALESGDGEFRIGVSTLQDMNWKQRLDLDACTSCGRCQAVCPAYNSGKVLSPKWLILDTRDHMFSLHADDALQNGAGAKAALDRLDAGLLQRFLIHPHPRSETGAEFRRADNPLVQDAAKSVGESWDTPLAGGVMDEDVFWACVTCRACVEVCPVGIEHVDYIVETRRSMALMEGNIPSEAQGSLRAIETRGNPFGPAEARTDWMEGLEVPFLEEGREVDIVYWVGCVSSYDKRKQKIARAMTKILNAAGANWGILGNKERCTGDPARRLGEENLFQNSAKQNIELLRTVAFKTLVANCPHCFNTIKNEYSEIGDFTGGRSVEVLHHSHLIRRFLNEGRISVRREFEEEITFHDPCYLGRYNDAYDEPRDVLVQIGAHRLKEMESSRNKGMCCGAGGGHYWFDMKEGTRINTMRVDQAAAVNAGTIATGCPFCMQMLEDGVKLTDRESGMKVRDIAELVASGLV